MKVLNAPSKHKKEVNLWADEAIWGHRFYNDQTPWLIILEFLAVFRSRLQDGQALEETIFNTDHERFTYRIPRSSPIRQLIFNNPHLQNIEVVNNTDGDRWSLWLNEMNSEHDYSYLKSRFGSFSRLVRVIEIFQNTAVEAHRKRRWTSRFLFPYGPNCIYADLPGQISGSPDRRFFARGGELLYLMLSRSNHERSTLAEKITKKLLDARNKWDRMACALTPNEYHIDHDLISVNSIAYLPFDKREEYNALASDWHKLLDLNLSGATLLDPLMRLSALHMLLYMIRRSHEEVGEYQEPKIILEILGPKKTTIQELSSDNLSCNRRLTGQAVLAFINRAKEDADWHNALNSRAQSEAVGNYLIKRFSWKPDDGHLSGDVEKIFENLKNYAYKRHNQHVAKVHTEWARNIGLSYSRRGVGTWYSPDDAFLKALVLVTVETRKEFHFFLKDIYDRYRLVVGVKEAEDAFGRLPTDEKAFNHNTQRLEQRLRTLGLLRRLSDDCAYVENPFSK